VAAWSDSKHKKMDEDLKEVEEKIAEFYERNVNGIFNEEEKESLRSLEISEKKLLD
jgi:hypothetical protein